MNIFKKLAGAANPSPPLDASRVITALTRVVHPESGRDIVQLQMVKNVAVANGKVSFALWLDEVGTPIRAPLERQIRAALAGIGAGEVKINWQIRNVPRPQLSDTIEDLQAKHIIAIASGKGGVGKTTIAVNLACALAVTGAIVGLLDADVHGPNVPLMMGVAGEQPMAFGERIIPILAHNVKLISMGNLVPSEVPVIWRGPMLSQALRQFLVYVVWGMLDYLIIDLPPGTGDVQLSLVQSIRLTGAILVTTPSEVALADVTKGLEMFRQLQVPILGIIENMSYYVCPDCGHRHDIFSHGGGKRLADKLGVPLLGEIPLDESVRAGGDQGKPLVVANPNSATAKAILKISNSLSAHSARTSPPTSM